jgi:hypothetical protein
MLPVLLPFFVFFTILVLLLPPLALITAVFRRYRHATGWSGMSLKYAWVLAAILPLLLNLAYLRSIWGTLLSGDLEPDFMLGLALIISWTSIWGRVAMRRLGRQRHQFRT